MRNGDQEIRAQGLRAAVRTFVLEKFPLARKKGIDDNYLLLQSGIVDSLGILDLVTFLDQRFEISISDEELVPENFATINALAEFLMAKLSPMKTSIRAEEPTGASVRDGGL